jgi:hypothetical protein
MNKNKYFLKINNFNIFNIKKYLNLIIISKIMYYRKQRFPKKFEMNFIIYYKKLKIFIIDKNIN